MKVTVSDMRPKFCMSGIRRFFARNNLDFRLFLREGIDAEELLATGDHQAIEVVESARVRNGE